MRSAHFRCFYCVFSPAPTLFLSRLKTQCGPMGIKRLSAEQVSAAKALHKDGKWGIGKLVKKYKVARNTIKSALRGSPSPKKAPRMTPKQKAVAARRQTVTQLVVKTDSRGVPVRNSSKRLSQALAKKNIPASARTVCRDLAASGARYLSRPLWPGLTTAQMATRAAFASAELAAKKSFGDLIFTDEKIFDTNDTERKMWVPDGQDPVPRRRSRWAPSCHVWGAIGTGFRYLRALPAGSVTSASYCETLQMFLRALPRGRKFCFQQDGAPAHTAKATITWLENKKVPRITNWPANSPDLNPIENLWGVMTVEVSRKAPSTKKELEKAIVSVFDATPQKTIDNLVKSFPNRLRTCVEVKGGKVQ